MDVISTELIERPVRRVLLFIEAYPPGKDCYALMSKDARRNFNFTHDGSDPFELYIHFKLPAVQMKNSHLFCIIMAALYFSPEYFE